MTEEKKIFPFSFLKNNKNNPLYITFDEDRNLHTMINCDICNTPALLQIPSHQRFTCLYCGHKINTVKLRANFKDDLYPYTLHTRIIYNNPYRK